MDFDEFDDGIQSVLYHNKVANELTPNVNKGVEFLDKESPGWYKKVDISNLHMEDGNRCICGWVFKDMMQGLDGYHSFTNMYPSSNSWEYGFLAAPTHAPTSMQYGILGELWIDVIEKRLANDE